MNLNPAKRLIPPVILIGMHRSGTSLVSRILRELGVFMGWDREINDEATFFLYRNEAILNFLGGSWANPVEVNFSYNNHEGRMILARLKKDINSLPSFSYLGPELFLKYRGIINLNLPWGWKDPRNTYTLSLWLEIFPGSKIIHIYRNGVDVAQSLIRRERRRLANSRVNRKGASYFFSRQIRLLREKGFMILLARRYWELIKYLEPLYKNYQNRIEDEISLDRGFQLWCTYLDQVKKMETRDGITIHHIKYENFLSHPEKSIKEIAQFCNIPCDNERIAYLGQIINPQRRFSFLENEDLVEFYKKVKDNYWMETLGYSKLLSA